MTASIPMEGEENACSIRLHAEEEYQVAAELGKDHPQLFEVAVETLGPQVTSDEQARAFGQALAMLSAPRPRARRPSVAVVKGPERVQKARFHHPVVEECVTKTMNARDRRPISPSLAATKQRTKVLRDFRGYFRPRVESGVRGMAT